MGTHSERFADIASDGTDIGTLATVHPKGDLWIRQGQRYGSDRNSMNLDGASLGLKLCFKRCCCLLYASNGHIRDERSGHDCAFMADDVAKQREV